MAAIVPMLVQIGLFFLVAHWASGRGSGAGFLGLGALLLLLLALPISLIANLWMIGETTSWRLLWVFLVGIPQALLIPALIVACFMLGVV